MAYKIIDGYQSGDAKVKAALDNYDFYIIPVVNPDGMPPPLLVLSMT